MKNTAAGTRLWKQVLLSFTAVSIVTAIIGGTAGKTPPKIKVGLGQTVITPKEFLKMRGFARSQVATGTHDELHARSLVVEDEDGEFSAMIAISLCGIGRDIAEEMRAKINDATGIPELNILISCTHTHAGPAVTKEVEPYRTYLIDQTVAGAAEAWNNRVPARIGSASGTVMELGRNRRKLLYGGLHPDPEVGILKIEDTEGNLLGVLFNYGCHPSALDWQNTLYSEDWPYFAIRGIKESVGEDVWVNYFQSAEGNINVGYSAELSAVGADMPIRNYEYIEVKGKQMARAVLDALPSITTSGDIDIAMAADTFDYPLRESFPITLKQAEKDAAEANDKLAAVKDDTSIAGTRIHDKFRADVFQTGQRLRSARRFYSRDGSEEKTTKIEQQALRIGDAVFVAVPGEIFAEVGLGIKNGSPIDKTFVIGIANGFGGYLPSAAEFVEGDYEVDGCKYSPKAEKACVESSLELVRRVAQ